MKDGRRRQGTSYNLYACPSDRRHFVGTEAMPAVVRADGEVIERVGLEARDGGEIRGDVYGMGIVTAAGLA